MEDGNVDVNVDVEPGATTDVDTSADPSADLETQIDDPDGENFDYDRWAEKEGLRKPEKSAPDLKKMKEDHDKKSSEKSGDDADQNTKDDPDSKGQAAGDTDQKTKDDPAPASKFEMKLKINGEEKTYTDVNEVQKLAQKGEAAEQKFFQATKIQNDVKGLLETLRDDPIKILGNPKFSKIRDAAEKMLYDEMRLEQLPEDQREGELAKRELAELKQQQENQQQDQQDQQQQNMTNHFKQQFTKDLTETLRISGLPDTQDNRLAIVSRMKTAISNNIPIDPNAIANDVRGTFNSNTDQTLANMTPEELAKTLGSATVEKLIKHRMNEVKSKQDGTQRQSKPRVLNKNSSSVSSSKKAKTYGSADEMMNDVWAGYS